MDDFVVYIVSTYVADICTEDVECGDNAVCIYSEENLRKECECNPGYVLDYKICIKQGKYLRNHGSENTFRLIYSFCSFQLSMLFNNIHYFLWSAVS